MNGRDDIELRLRDWMASTAPSSEPEGLVDRAVAGLDRVRQRPGLLVRTGVERSWLAGPTLSPAARLALLGLLLLAIAVAAVVVGSRLLVQLRPVPVFPARLQLTVEDATPMVDGNRQMPTVAALADGRVLIMGGISVIDGASRTLSSAEVFDPRTGRSTATGPMNVARADAAAVTLADGRVLVVGGMRASDNADVFLASAELFDPGTSSFTAVQPMESDRSACHCGVRFIASRHIRGTPIGNGDALVAGGSQDAPSRTADVFHAATRSFERMPIGCDAGRGAQTALRDGRVLVICFVDANGTTLARIYDPGDATFIQPAQPSGANVGDATLLPDGRVLLTGIGATDGGSSAEIYDPAKDTWAFVRGGTNPRPSDPAVTLADGRVAFLGGEEAPSWAFDPSRDAFTMGNALGATFEVEPLLLADGRLMTLSRVDNKTVITTIVVGE